MRRNDQIHISPATVFILLKDIKKGDQIKVYEIFVLIINVLKMWVNSEKTYSFIYKVTNNLERKVILGMCTIFLNRKGNLWCHLTLEVKKIGIV